MFFKKFLSLVFVGMFLAFALPASGATFLVNSIADTNDALLGNGLCVDSSGFCSLRAAVEEANAFAGDDSITFSTAINGQSIVLTRSTQIVIDSKIEITGPGAKFLTIDGGSGGNRIFLLNAGSDLKLSKVTVRGGNGGGPPVELPNYGGAIMARSADLELSEVWLTGNSASEVGGGLYLEDGQLIVRRSTISGNNAKAGGGVCLSDAVSYFVNSTIASNIVSSTVLDTHGGGIALFDSTANFRSSTVAFNFAFAFDGQTSRGGGISVNSWFGSSTPSHLILANTIVSGNSSSLQRDVLVRGGQVTSNTRNLISDSNTLTPTNWRDSDLLGRQPGTTTISPIDNGGPTPTLALQPMSAAIDAGTGLLIFDPLDGSLLLTDQRGLARYVGDFVDIGAYEFSNAPTGAHVSVAGRVVDESGAGLRGVRISLTDSSGNIRSARSGSFGYFRFDDVESGQTVVISASAKGRTFQPVAVNAADDVTDVFLVGLRQ